VWHPDDPRPRYQDMHPSATLGSGATLSGEDVVSGFSLSVADAFADPL